jgi:hypothetical protein
VAQSPDFLALAARCRADAEIATLANVRERCLRAEAAWLDMARRQHRFEESRAERAAASAMFPACTGGD